MKILLLVQKEQRVILDRLYDSIAEHVGSCELRWLSRSEQKNLQAYFSKIDIDAYDRIVFFLRFKQEIRQVGFISSIPHLVILEHDAYQNYIPGKYQGEFSRHYARLPWARVISSGWGVTQRLRTEGVDAEFVPKGYDQLLLRNLHQSRTVEIGFLGSIESKVYEKRKELLSRLVQEQNLLLLRTRSGDEYLQKLNEIRFFVSADVGMGEYMIKNFEAMACGCVLFAFNQGDAENEALGLVDMHNVVLYRDYDELVRKLERLRSDTVLAQTIARNGEQLAQQRFQFFAIGREIAREICKPMRVPRSRSLLSRLLGRYDSFEPAPAHAARIAIVIPYFGHWPFWMSAFWESCRRNPQIDWLIYSDCPKPAALPANVHFTSIGFDAYKHRVSARLGIRFNPESAYKLCDLKPMYGYIHQEELAAYDFFGFGDIDVMYGDLGNFLTENLLRHDVISTHEGRISGHFCLLRNTEKFREAFRRVDKWQELLENPDHLRFDEKHFSKVFVAHKNWPPFARRLVGIFDDYQRDVLFRETFSTPDTRIPWEDGGHAFPTAWYWRDGILSNNLRPDKSYPYLHFLAWKRVWSAAAGVNVPKVPDDAMLARGISISVRGFDALD